MSNRLAPAHLAELAGPAESAEPAQLEPADPAGPALLVESFEPSGDRKQKVVPGE